MIKLAILKVKPNEESRLRSWMTELTRRNNEVLETFAQEGVRHEQAYLLKTGDGPILIYAVEALDQDRAALAFRNSKLAIDAEHKQLMGRVLGGSVDAELLYECKVEGAG